MKNLITFALLSILPSLALSETHTCTHSNCTHQHESSTSIEKLNEQAKKEDLNKYILKNKTNVFILNKNGEIFINNHPIKLDSVDALLHILGEDATVYMSADKDTNTAMIFKLMDKIRHSKVKISSSL